MDLLRSITFAVVVTGLCGCSTTTTVKFDDHLRYDEDFRPIITKPLRIPGVKIQQSSTGRIAPKLHEVYKRIKLDVRLEDNILAYKETANYPMGLGSVVLLVGNLFEKIFTNNNDAKYLLSIKETELTMRMNVDKGIYDGTYFVIAAISNGEETEIIKINEDYDVPKLGIYGPKNGIEDAIDELYRVVRAHLDVWENN